MDNEILETVNKIAAGRNFAVGNDLVFLPEFEKSFNDNFKNKVYTPNEIAYCEQFDKSILRFASTWAAKEAVYKAVKQIDTSPLGPKTIEIIRTKTAGEPQAILHTKHSRLKISLSISHDGDYVWAIAFIETNA